MIENMMTLQKMDYPASLIGAIKQTIPIWYTRENGVLGLSPLSDKEIADAFIQAEKDISNGTSYLEMYFKDKKTMQEISDTYEISRYLGMLLLQTALTFSLRIGNPVCNRP
jgi:hypothetical protein